MSQLGRGGLLVQARAIEFGTGPPRASLSDSSATRTVEQSVASDLIRPHRTYQPARQMATPLGEEFLGVADEPAIHRTAWRHRQFSIRADHSVLTGLVVLVWLRHRPFRANPSSSPDRDRLLCLDILHLRSVAL
jgi:hypothetical protein